MQPDPQDVFVSYSHADLDAAQALHQALLAAGHGVFIDFTGLRNGDRWLDKLEQALAGCGAFVVLVGAQGIQRWVGAEVGLALQRHHGPHDPQQRLPIHPLLLPGADAAPLRGFLSLFQAQPWQPGQPLPQGLLDALAQRRAQPQARPLLQGCPYVGLASYRREQAHLYFGRRAEVLQALACLGDQQQRGPQAARSASGDGYWRWLQVEGHSGSGKSSLVHAGLLPLVEAGALWPRTGLEHWRILGPMLPGQRPAERLAELLEHALKPEGQGRDLASRHQQLQQQPRALVHALSDLHRPGQGLLLVVDQFEELYTFADAAERQVFDTQLAQALADADCPLFVVSTVRSDFTDRLDHALPQLAALFNRVCKPFRLPPVGEAGLRELIEMPARLAGLDVAQVLAPLQHEAAGEPGALPLVEHALQLLWADAGGSGVLRADDLLRRGGLAGMLRSQADALLSRAERTLAPGGRQAALELLLALTHPGPEGRHTRRRIARADAVAAACPADSVRGERVLQLLAGEREPGRPSQAPSETLRLVTTGTERGPTGNQAYVDLIHETLLRRRPAGAAGEPPQPYWPALFEHIEANKDRPALLQELDRDRRQFEAASALGRWRLLPHRQRLLEYAALPLAPGSAAARFVARCRRLWWQQVVLGVAGVVALGVWAAGGGSGNGVRELGYTVLNPVVYGVVQLGWALGLEAPLPKAVPLKALAPGETFTMGCVASRDLTARMTRCPDVEPVRQVPMEQPCAMAETETTNLQFARFVWETQGGFAWNPLTRHSGNGRFGSPSRPVVEVTWLEAHAYARWLRAKTGQPWRLPTEEEWEYAARDPARPGPYPWGREEPEGRANCAECGDAFSGEATAPVASYSAVNGLHDMAGNVWEWTESVYRSDAAYTDASRVLRGGAWYDVADHLRAANRFRGHPVNRDVFIGFRLCRASPIETPATVPPDAGPLAR